MTSGGCVDALEQEQRLNNVCEVETGTDFMTWVNVSHCWFLVRSNSTKVEGYIVAAQIKSIM
jgi:hypothetical protein